jgi:hypothetical protein
MKANQAKQVVTFGGFIVGQNSAAIGRNTNASTLNPDDPVPLWLKARARAIGFRHDDLVRTHWKKVWRSMVCA